MSDFNIQFEEQDQSITLEFEQIGGGAVKSVNGKVGDVVLNASDVGALPSSTSIPTVDATLSVTGAAADAKKTGDEITSLKEDISQVIDSAYVTDTASGAIASFPDGADGVPVKSLTVNIEPVQSGSGDPSPTNIRPISGHTQAKVTRTGKNLFDSSLLSDVASGIKYETVTLKPYTQYTMSSTIPIQGGNTTNLFFMLPSETANSGTNGVNINRPVTLTTGADGQAKVGYRLGNNTVSQYLAYNFQIEFGSTATEYNAYSQPHTVTVDLDGTRYGGSFDVGTGVLTVDRQIVDLGTLTWTWDASLNRAYTRSLQGVMSTDANLHSIADSFVAVNDLATLSTTTKGIFISNQAVLSINNNGKASLADFVAFITGKNLVYSLASAQTVQLTAQEVTTLLGQNNIWADTGDTEVTYRADTKLYIQKVMSS